MRKQANEAPPLPLLIGGVAAILLGTSGFAAVMARTPASMNEAGIVLARDEVPTPPAERAGARSVPAWEEGAIGLTGKCPDCAVIASLREIEQLRAGIDPGTAGETRGDRNAKPGGPTTSREITVRMKDGSSRVFKDPNPANWRPGQRVILIEGATQDDDHDNHDDL